MGPLALALFLFLTIVQEYWYDTTEKKQNTKILDKERRFRVLLQAAQKLKLRYQRGDQEGLIEKNILKCHDIPKSPLVNKDYLKCNPHYLNCFLGAKVDNLQNKFPIHWEGVNYEVKANPLWENRGKQKIYYRIISKSQFPGKKIPHYAVQLNLSFEEEGESLNVLLEDTCRDVYLPQRIYTYREHGQGKKKSNEFTWNNFNQDIYIDKRLVTFRDLVDWLEVHPEEKISIPKSKAQWALPASHLTVQQMEKYCHFLGKQTANTLVYDAASFHPTNIQQPTSVDRYFPPFPWSKKKSSSPLLDIQRGRAPFNKSICSDILTSECVSQTGSIQNSIHQRTSWTGLKDLLGGHPEYLRNPINPQLNLKASSFYLNSASSWHHLGKRGSWSGKGFDLREFMNEGKAIFVTTHTSFPAEGRVTVVPFDQIEKRQRGTSKKCLRHTAEREKANDCHENEKIATRQESEGLLKNKMKVGFRCMFEGPGEA